MKQEEPLKPLKIILGERKTLLAKSPERQQTSSDRTSNTRDYVNLGQMGEYRRDHKRLGAKFDEFIRDNAGLGFFDSIVALQNTEDNPFEMISINSDSDFCDRKDAYLKIPGFFGRLAICCSLATRRENMSVLFLGNILGRKAAKKRRKRKLYCRGERNVAVTAISAEDHAAEEVGTVVPAEIEGICSAVERATVSMEKKGSKIEEEVIGEDGIPTVIQKEADPRNQTLVINVGVFSVKNEMMAEEGSAVRMCVITCNGVYRQDSAMQIMTQLKEDINKVKGCEKMGVFIVPMEETPLLISQGTRYVHCETLFANLVRDTISNSSRMVTQRESEWSVQNRLQGEPDDGLSAEYLVSDEGGTTEEDISDEIVLPSVGVGKENDPPEQAEDLDLMPPRIRSHRILEPPTLKRKKWPGPLKLPEEKKGKNQGEDEQKSAPGKST
ncbi:MAG: hypothetical protein VX737_01215 [Pseudomonadota bacterium]|nr:hypothetical protein [Pseudomonadota bacterium]